MNALGTKRPWRRAHSCPLIPHFADIPCRGSEVSFVPISLEKFVFRNEQIVPEVLVRSPENYVGAPRRQLVFEFFNTICQYRKSRRHRNSELTITFLPVA